MKVLLISHNPITTYQNMGKTFLSMFSEFSKEEICQLYIYPTIPDVDICDSYYRITDRDIMKSYFHFGKVNSEVICKERINPENHSFFESKEDADFYKKRKKNSYRLLLRDAMWFFSNWYNTGLKKWLDEQKPTCIFLAPGESKFIYNIALYISKKLNIDLNTYICDEYYFVNSPDNFVDKIQLYCLKKKIEQTMKKTSQLFTICDELAEVYYNKFKTKTHILFTGANCLFDEKPKLREHINGITYMGNLAYKRYEAIAEIGCAIDEINDKLGSNYKLFIYAKELKEEVVSCFNGINSIEYCGYVTGAEYKKVLYGADILLHVEAFDVECMERVKHSISTKIADCLGSGIPLLAYGPADIASINYLRVTESAFLCTEREKLSATILGAFDIEARKMISENAMDTANLNHDASKNSKKLYEILRRGE